jgi:hypothetical protein
MSEPGQEGQQPPSEIWSRWRERRAARRASSGGPPPPPSPTEEPAAPTEHPTEPPATAVEPEPPSANGGESAHAFSIADEPPPPPPPPEPDPIDPAAQPHAHDHECLEWCPICRTADVVRASVPPELRDQWADVQREALATLRAMIDHYLARSEQQQREASRVEDIPIE